MNKAVIFCTSCIDLDPQRYQDWIDYYTDFFEGLVDLWMINDGPFNHQLDLKGIELRSFDKKLGRETTWIFPGWKRSFYYGLRWLTSKYRYVGHIESDCWVTQEGKQPYLEHLFKDGYYGGYAPAYNFIETALQVINSSLVRQYFLDKYSCEDNWSENINFEKELEILNPTYILSGDRIECKSERIKNHFTFLSGMNYQDYKRFYERLLSSPRDNQGN